MKLLPCPFCRSKPTLIERKCSKTKFAVGCSNIECIIYLPSDVNKRNLHNYAWAYVDKRELIKAWNKRSNDENKKI